MVGPGHGGELLESSGEFSEGTMSSSIAGVIEIPAGSSEGQWNIRIILENDLGVITNLELRMTWRTKIFKIIFLLTMLSLD